MSIKDVITRRCSDGFYFENSDDENDELNDEELEDMFFTNVAAYDDKLFVSTSCGLVLKVSALDFHLDFAKKVFSSDISAMIYGD